MVVKKNTILFCIVPKDGYICIVKTAQQSTITINNKQQTTNNNRPSGHTKLQLSYEETISIGCGVPNAHLGSIGRRGSSWPSNQSKR